MRIYDCLEKMPRFRAGTAVAVGNFDGLHLGHRKIIHSLVQAARKRGLSSLILTFSPHPEKVLGKRRVQLIQTLAQRLDGFRNLRVSSVMVLPFDDRLSRLTAEDFAAELLAGRLKTREVVVGENFRFGRDRRGDVGLLYRLGERFGFGVTAVRPVKIDGQTVSSSLVRSRLREGSMEDACLLLGSPYEIEGVVVRDRSLGRTIGFPTANLSTSNEILPPGVFITRAVLGRASYPSLTNIGHRPTFGAHGLSVECHILSFRRKLYDRCLRIRFLKRIRDEVAFSSAEELRLRIITDIKEARVYFERCS
jgi:riboflavin kinase/FMN adenylyltransferase